MAKLTRLVLLLLALLVVVWSFADFLGRSYQRHLANAQRPVELTILHWGDFAEDKIVKDLCDRFEKENPRVRINRINAGGNFDSKLKTMMAADMAPDVFYLPPRFLADLATMKLIAPLDDYVKSESQEWKNDFWPILIDAFKYDPASGTTGKGSLYALPKDFTTAVFYINCDLFDKAGIDWRAIQKNGWTWDEFQTHMQKIRDLNGQAGFENREVYGTLFQIWGDTLRNILWTFGGDFFASKADGSPDFSKSALDTPESQAGLKLITEMRLKKHTAFNATGIAKDGGQEFLNGNIGCTGPVGVWMVPQYKDIKKFKWDIVPIPYAREKVSQIFYTGWTMSSRSKSPKEAYELIRFLCGKDGQIQQGEAELAIPALQSIANSDHFLHAPGIPKHNAREFLNAVPHARIQQLPRMQEWDRILGKHTNAAIQAGTISTEQAARNVQADWTDELNSPLRQKQWPTMPWNTIAVVSIGAGLAIVGSLWMKAKREKLGPLDRATERAGWLFISPWVIGFTVLTLGPMIVSLLLALSRWTGMTPLGDAEFVGTANWQQLIQKDPSFYRSLKVTAYYVIIGVPVFQIAALAVAMLMNSRVKGINIFRTIFFVPSVVSGVALAVLWLQLFNNDYGLINKVLNPILHLFGQHAPNWFGIDSTNADHPVNDAMRWAIPGFVLMGLWGVGGGMLIYLAGLKGIPVSLYEAATIDGAGPIRKFWNVTLPMLSPLIFYNLVMGIIGSFQVFTQAFTMTGAGPDDATLFYVLHLYNNAFVYHNMGYASAMAWVLFAIVLVLTAIVFRGSKNLVYYEGLKS